MRMKDKYSDMGVMASDGDMAFLEKVIDQKKNFELKEALQE